VSVLYVAELGSQHKGNVALACEYARQFQAAGADVLKMQFGHPASDPVRYVSPDMAETVQRYCLSIGLELMASIFSFDGMALARHIGMKRYKVAHQLMQGEKANFELVKTIIDSGQETFVSIGDPDDGLEEWLREPIHDQILGAPHAHVIFTTSSYPTYSWDLEVPCEFTVWYGYSDHTHGLGACLLAVARGARYIEKHVALDKTDLWTKDTSFSATPDEFGELVRLGREIERVRDAAT
jgi:N,N'-diacetyllegionaminate synthase